MGFPPKKPEPNLQLENQMVTNFWDMQCVFLIEYTINADTYGNSLKKLRAASVKKTSQYITWQ